MIRRPPRSTPKPSSAASDVYKRQDPGQPASSVPARGDNDGLRERLWWSCFALERLIQLECGRPSSISPEYDRLFDSGSSLNNDLNDSGSFSPLIYFTSWVSLAEIMGQISERLYSAGFFRSADMLGETARLDRRLTEWEASLPGPLQPRNTLSGHATDEQIFAIFLAQQYYHVRPCPQNLPYLSSCYIIELRIDSVPLPGPNSGPSCNNHISRKKL